jgi:hypothetical protein
MLTLRRRGVSLISIYMMLRPPGLGRHNSPALGQDETAGTCTRPVQ